MVALLGIAVVGSGAWYWHTRNVSQAQTQFGTASEDLSGDITRALGQNGDLLAGSAALFDQGVVTRAQYHVFLKSQGFEVGRFPGMLGVGLIQEVSAGQLPAFLASLNADGVAVSSIAPSGERPEYCLGSYADWTNLKSSVPLFGYDFCTVPALAEVLTRATATAQQQVLSGSVLGPRYSSDFLLVRAVQQVSPTSTSTNQQLSGWAVAIISAPELLKSIQPARGLQFLVFSGTSGGGHQGPVLRWPTSVKKAGPWPLSMNISAYGTWSIRFHAAPDFPPSVGMNGGPIVFLVFGLLSVALLAALLYSLRTARDRALREVHRATLSLRSSEERFRTLVGSSSDLIAVVNDKAELIYANPAGERMLSLDPEDQTGRNMLELVHPDDLEAVMTAFSRDISEPGIHPPSVYRFQAASGEWRNLEVTANNCLDERAIAGIVVNARDVTEQTNLSRALRTLGRANEALVHASDETSLLVDTCKTVVDAGGYTLAWVGYAEHDEACTVRPVASSGHLDRLKEIHVSWGDNEYGNGPVGMAIRSGRVQVADELSQTRAAPESLAAVARYGLRTSCALPLEVGGVVIGALSIYAAEPGAFGPSEVSLLSELGDALSYGVGRLRDADALRASEERFRTLADAAPIGILEAPPDGGVTYANLRSAEIGGRDVEDLLGWDWIEAVHPDDRLSLLAFIDVNRPRRQRYATSFRVQHPDGEVRRVRMSAAPKGPGGKDGWVTTIEDITEEVHAQEELAHQAFYDTLTSLPNRYLFLDRLNQELARHRREGSQIAVLFLDLDRFKIVNDSLGHEAGDSVLKEMGARLLRAVRAGETAARFGGDEFIFIVRDVHKIEDAETAAKRLLTLIETPFRWEGKDLTVTGSIGIVMPRSGADAGMILRDADTAMYHAKEAGRNTYALFDQGLHERSVLRLELEGELRQALNNDEFELYYQPGVEPASERPVGAEALIRWHHPTRGLVPPLDFIPVAEDSGLILPIGRWVFEKAVSQLAAWDAAEDGPRLDVIAVNLSARQLGDPETPAIVQGALERYGIAGGRVSVEVTESVIMAKSESTRRSLQSLKDLGVRVAIDDFGTGYSSLAYLHTLPVTTVKIDRSFVERLGGEDDSTPVVQAIIEMSHAMGLRVLAEGVEDDVRRMFLAGMGCDLAQGFYWARPMPAEDFADWWQNAERRAATS